jgi:anti-sigma factor RsiW
MACFQDEDWIDRYLDGELSPPNQERFEEHLAGCQTCQRDLAQARALFAVLEGLQDAPAPQDLLKEVLAGLPSRPAARAMRWLLVAQAAAALLLLGLAYPQWTAWVQRLSAWFSPGWLSHQVDQAAAWGRDTWTWLAGALAVDVSWSWPTGFGLTWPQAAAAALALVGLWWLGNRLLLAPGPNRTGTT